MGFEWDEESDAGKNFRKQGVRMPEAIPVFDEFVTPGMGAAGRLPVVGAAESFPRSPKPRARPGSRSALTRTLWIASSRWRSDPGARSDIKR